VDDGARGWELFKGVLAVGPRVDSPGIHLFVLGLLRFRPFHTSLFLILLREAVQQGNWPVTLRVGRNGLAEMKNQPSPKSELHYSNFNVLLNIWVCLDIFLVSCSGL
jgi:hypothetical protein